MNVHQNWVRGLLRRCILSRRPKINILHKARYSTSSVVGQNFRRPLLQFQSVRSSGVLPSSVKQRLMEVTAVRRDATDIFDAAVSAVYPPQMIRNAVQLKDDGTTLVINGETFEVENNVYIVGFGKAVSGMARAIEDILGDHIVEGVISIPHGSQELFRSIEKDALCLKENSKITVYEGAENNMPDEIALKAASAILELVQNLQKDHLLIVLISGGGSALLPSPIPPITLADQLELTKVVSKNGGSIYDLNVLRQNIETLKGGGLAEKASPAQVVSLILSDVIEDKLDIISSGPTSPLLSSPRQCLQILDRLLVKDKVPSVIVEMLEDKATEKKSRREVSPRQLSAESFQSNWEHVHNVIIGSNYIATQAALQKAKSLGYVPLLLTSTLQGEAKTAAAMFAQMAFYIIHCFDNLKPDQGNVTLSVTEIGLIKLGVSKMQLKQLEAAATEAYNSRSGVCIVCGGETIVNVCGDGTGGRNQEMALAFAIEYKNIIANLSSKVFDKYHVEFLSAGTDGQDGPTDAAGAVVNRFLIPAALSAQLVPSDYLTNNDSNTFFKSVQSDNCLIQTGLTGTNVMDIQTLIIKPL